MKRDNELPATDRRQWMKGIIRKAALGGIAILVTYVAGRQVGSGCLDLTSRCAACRLLTRCDLPQAKSARAAVAEKESS